MLPPGRGGPITTRTELTRASESSRNLTEMNSADIRQLGLKVSLRAVQRLIWVTSVSA